MTATLDRYERAARAAFEYAYPRGYGMKSRADWDSMKRLAARDDDARARFPTIAPYTASKVLTLYRGIAKRAIEA